LIQAFLKLLLLASASFCYTAWGVWLSWHFRSPVTAMAVALVSMLLVLGVVPWLFSFFLPRGIKVEDVAAMWHPWFAIGQLSDHNTNSRSARLGLGLTTSTVLTLIGFVLLWDLNRRISKAWRLPRQAIFKFSQRPVRTVKEAT
jgi:hypothetical protein